MRLGRRAFLVASSTLVACKGARVPLNPPGIALWSSCDLPREPLTNELSGIAWDEARGVAYAVQDKRSNIVTLVPDPNFRRWTVGDHIAVDVGGPLDLEGLALLSDGFVVVAEIGPHIFELDRDGHLRREVPVPASLLGPRENKSLESVAVTADGRFLFTANEEAGPRDGPLATDEHGTRVRIVRIDRVTGATSETLYLTDRAQREHGDYGVADIAALAATEVLVLERGWARGYGNTVRVYRASTVHPGKSLVVDLDALELKGSSLPAPNEPQPTPLLDNFEGMTLGPRLPNGQRALILVSDDNTRGTQVARVVVLSWSGA